MFSMGCEPIMAGMRGALLCLLSAAAFGTLGIFGTLASDAGATVAGLSIGTRLALAALAGLIATAMSVAWQRIFRREMGLAA